jgi:zinc/manganese transport system substrate-binding protein
MHTKLQKSLLTALAALALLIGGAVAAAGLEVVASAPSMGALARAVGGPATRVTVLADPGQDLHRLQVRPAMLRSLRGADLVVAIGAELEVGWLPPAIAGAANPVILPGQPGYFEAAAQVPLLDTGAAADRALGDVHPLGNPHLDLDPVRMAAVATALAERMAMLDPAGAPGYRDRAAAFAAQVQGRLPAWQAQLAGAPGALLYHRDAVYLLDRFGVPLLGSIEAVPGVAPGAGHLSRLRRTLAGQRGVVIHAPYQPPATAAALARDLGWPLVVLPLEPPAGADGKGYLDHIGRWVDALASAR